MNNVPELPYDFTFDSGYSLEEVIQMGRSLNKCIKYLNTKEKLKITEKRSIELHVMKDILCDYVQSRHGIDVSSRLINEEKIQFLSPKHFRKKTKKFKLTTIYGFTTNPYLEIVVKEEKDNTKGTISTANHELIHAAGYKILHFSDDYKAKASIRRWAFESDDKFRYINEGVVEYINCLCRQKYWRKNKCLKEYAENYFWGDEDYLLFFMGLVYDLSRRTGIDSKEVGLMFERGYFLGDFKILDLLKKTYGAKKYKKIAGLKNGDSKEYIDAIKKELFRN